MRKGSLRALALSLMMCASITTTPSEGRDREFRLLRLDGSHVKWVGQLSGRTTITYALIDQQRAFADAHNCGRLVPIDELLAGSRIAPHIFQRELRAAFDLWEKAVHIRFVEARESETPGIVIGAQEMPIGRAYADVAYLPGEGEVREISRSLICLNPLQPWKVGFDGNLKVYDLRYTLAHEIGHAIGLDHPADAKGQLMSFKYHEQFDDLQSGDIQGAVRLYGSKHLGSVR